MTATPKTDDNVIQRRRADDWKPSEQLITSGRIVDLIDDIACHHLAFEAVESLLSPQKIGNQEDLTHVDRSSLGWLLTILNASMRQRINAAKSFSQDVHELNRLSRADVQQEGAVA